MVGPRTFAMRLAGCVAGLMIAVFAAPDARAQAGPLPDNPGSSGSSLSLGPAASFPPHDVHRHDGFYFRYSIGPSYVEATGSGPSGSVGAGGIGVGEVLAVGGTPATGVVVAATAVAHLVASDVNGSATLLTIGNYGVLVDWFPDPGAGWHVGVALGLGFTGFGQERGYTAGASLVGGYDFWVAPQWSLGALLVASSMPRVTMQGGSALDPDDLLPAAIAIEATVLCH